MKVDSATRKRIEDRNKKFEEWWNAANLENLHHLKEYFRLAWEAGCTSARKKAFKGF